MSFGYSVDDILFLGQLAWKAYKSCKDAPESFKNISHEVLSLHALLKELEENLCAQTLSSTRQARLKTIGDGCRNVLEELQSLVDKYESLGTQSKRTWDRMKWAQLKLSSRKNLTTTYGSSKMENMKVLSSQLRQSSPFPRMISKHGVIFEKNWKILG
ncbi:hypothetical protein GP486_005832 [Trichoglossum hirsutum]|uniref:NACHT-NTPase and P-loop NTPases N-terminal domain-containing protein n=1 Tax=Trichoglossum hirsutum TaxID=265104 RepID=A0A9P8L8G2_9PEZI|nr:hypothetical protein GP486_005832 [Trichoglossum hirsutum]